MPNEFSPAQQFILNSIRIVTEGVVLLAFIATIGVWVLA